MEVVLSPKIFVPIKAIDINVKVFNIITNKNGAKTMDKHISCDFKCKFNSVTFNSNQVWNNQTCQCECRNYLKCKKDYSWNPSTCICENGNVMLQGLHVMKLYLLWIFYQQK